MMVTVTKIEITGGTSLGERVEMTSSVLDRSSLRCLCNVSMEMFNAQLYIQI